MDHIEAIAIIVLLYLIYRSVSATNSGVISTVRAMAIDSGEYQHRDNDHSEITSAIRDASSDIENAIKNADRYYDYDKQRFEDGSKNQIIFQLTKIREAISDLTEMANDLRTHLDSIDREVQAIGINTQKEVVDYDEL